MINKNDLRYIKTHDLIISTFLDALKTHGYDKTNITLICKNARISRKTFYNHFINKENVLEEILETLEEDMIKKMPENLLSEYEDGVYLSATRWIVEFLNENRDIASILLENTYEEFSKSLHNVIVKHIEEMVSKDFGTTYSIKVDLYNAFVFNGILGFISALFENFDEIPVEETVQDLDFLTENASHLIYKELTDREMNSTDTM